MRSRWGFRTLSGRSASVKCKSPQDRQVALSAACPQHACSVRVRNDVRNGFPASTNNCMTLRATPPLSGRGFEKRFLYIAVHRLAESAIVGVRSVGGTDPPPHAYDGSAGGRE